MKGDFFISKLPEFDDHELVFFGANKKTGLRSFIAVHNTNLGPAVGGTRFRQYRSESEALRDALRLSRAMTYKCALAKVPYGGGKGVIVADSGKLKKAELVRAYAEKVDILKDRFFTGEDVGIDEDDIRVMLTATSSIIGRPGVGGDPSPWAAAGVYAAMQAALKAMYGSPDIHGRTFAVKGLGKVGFELCRLIYREGGRLIGADTDTEAVKRAMYAYPRMKIVDAGEIYKRNIDVFSPCALGGDLNLRTIPQLRCKIVCGGANNQLESPADGGRLYRRGILYIPDYLANAGGLINVVAELDKRGYDRGRVERKVKAIEGTADEVIRLSKKKDKPTSEVADRLAEDIYNHRE